MEEDRERRKAEEEKRLMLQASNAKVEDYTLTWVNRYFKLDVETEVHVEAAFPIIILAMIDVIYPKKVRWHQVDWNAGYLHALHRNHAVLEKIWHEVNMDKVKDFRNGEASLQIENTIMATCEQKLHFLKQVKRWFDQRVQHSNEYDPIERRTEMEMEVRRTGRFMKFPTWMQYDKEAVQANRSMKPDPTKKGLGYMKNTTEYEQMPEFKRLIWFLGSADHTNL